MLVFIELVQIKASTKAGHSFYFEGESGLNREVLMGQRSEVICRLCTGSNWGKEVVKH